MQLIRSLAPISDYVKSRDFVGPNLPRARSRGFLAD